MLLPERLLERDPEGWVVVEHARDEVVHGRLPRNLGTLLVALGAPVLVQRTAVLVRVPSLGRVPGSKSVP